ncbi:hypothetical protein CMI37_31750 [Candidatus Pacearchaeota archaeon]|nr:hypothetical protein [Candidatus Pacearchaeota archaeon]
MTLIEYIVGLIGLWLFSDAILSITLYLNAPSYDGSPKQSWRKDHWVRAVRALCGIALMVIIWFN